jgi:hypothetical protein
MEFVPPEAVTNPHAVAVLGAAGGRRNEAGTVDLADAAFGRLGIARDIIRENPDTCGYILGVAGWGEFSSPDSMPTVYEGTETAAQTAWLQKDLSGVGHEWCFRPPFEKGQSVSKEHIAGTTIQEIKLIVDSVKQIKAAEAAADIDPARRVSAVHVVAGSTHLQRVNDILTAANPDALPDGVSWIGVINPGEREGLKAVAMRWAYRALVIRRGLSLEEMVEREQVIVGREFGAAEAVKAVIGLRRNQLARAA